MDARAQPDGRISVTQPGIAHLLRVSLLSVPIYQRPYAWEQEQLTDYWDDLRGALSDNPATYFLGTIVVTRDGVPSRLNVVDGQQRLATTLILIAAIRNAFLARGDESRANNVEITYLAGRDLATDDIQPRMLLNADDNAFFTRRILPRSSEKEDVLAIRPSHSRLAKAEEYFAHQIQNFISDSGNTWQASLARWIEFLRDDVTIVLVEVADEASAFTIFETLNDRGMDLTIADLVKNYLFSLAGSEYLHTVANAWTSSVSLLDNVGDPRIFTTFVRHYWSSKFGVVRERQLFKELRQHVTTSAQAMRFVSELHQAAQLYSALMNSDHDFWASFGVETRHHIETLLRFQLEQSRPMTLAAMQHFSATELQRLVGATVSWSVRGIIAGGLGGGAAEKAFSSAGIAIRNGTLKTAQDVFGHIAAVIPTDLDFETRFSTLLENRAKYNRYYLQELEVFANRQYDPEFVPNRDERQVTLEHVLPRSMDPAQWPSFANLEPRDWIWRLGNLVLIPKSINNQLGNKSFSQKKVVLANSNFELTKQVAAEADWTPATLERRQRRLAALAVQVWPRTP